jgi:hypothetical protein
VGDKRFGEGDLLWWCGINASIWLERANDGMKHYRKMKRRQRAHLGSMIRNHDTVRRCGDVGWRRCGTGEEKGGDDVN